MAAAEAPGTTAPIPALCGAVAALLLLNLAAGVSGKFIALSPGRWGLICLLVGVVVGSYAVRLCLWLYLGRRWQLSFVYPLLALNYLFSALAGRWLFGERLSACRVAGLATIMAGVVLIASSPHRRDPGRERSAAACS
ncbi:MAG: EamA family transporter [Lentisphaeria bacterium]|nr:EamA family transporter [Lentisphaeria bacterium]